MDSTFVPAEDLSPVLAELTLAAEGVDVCVAEPLSDVRGSLAAMGSSNGADEAVVVGGGVDRDVD